MAGTPFDESEVVNGLRKSSPKFNDFYQNERLKYDDKIEWLQNTDLEEGLNAYAAVDRDKISRKIITRKIYFQKFPDANDALLVAHEIMHVIRAIEDKSLGFKENSYPHLANAFRNMIEDPIVDSFLKEKYNFDLLVKYKKDLVLPKRDLDQIDKEPTEKIRKLIWIINLTKQLRCWKLIEDQNAQKEWVDYQVTFKDNFPNIWKMGNEFLLFIEENGFDTRDKQKIIMQEFNDRFNRPHKD